MQSYEALEKAIGRDTVLFAKKLALSLSMVNKWKEPSIDFTDSGALNPLDRLETIISTAKQLKKTNEEAFAPLRWLGQQFDVVFVRVGNRPHPGPLPGAGEGDSIEVEMLKVVKEMGEAAAEVGKGLEDKKLDKFERERCKKELWDLVEQAVLVFKMLEAMDG